MIGPPVMNRYRTRWLMLLMALALSFVGGVAPASAAPTLSPAVMPAQAPGEGVITIITMSNGDATAKPVSGVVFDLYKVQGVDLSTDAGWELAKKYVDDPDLVADLLGEPTKLPATDAEGKTRITGVEDGLWYTRQVSGGDGITYTDMIFSMPNAADARDGENPEWTRTLDVYPKIIVTTPTTTITTRTVTNQPTSQPTSDPTADGDPAPKAQTGDGADFEGLPYVMAALLGVAVLGGAFYLTRRRPENNEG